MLSVLAIGHVVGGRTTPVDDDWDAVTATIRLDATRFTPAALRGLEAFSHLEVLYHFHRVAGDAVHTGARRPRGNPDWPEVGIFAQRGKDRPNRLGVSVCRIEAVDGLEVHVRGLDAIDGTPVLDLKPVLREFLPRGELRQPAWASELMTGYW
ncbi:SAM-dependent methyltransferase [Solirubrobacter soli]|uniref:SAM-dependent methyltransferase n=1 Tax=Solirubrobacter soli TaxID=363832 RepID=UPI000428EB86|nr:SAM-dependent methyltransferase [Solirubrobacter soli]